MISRTALPFKVNDLGVKPYIVVEEVGLRGS
jgi:hypothetical protein